MRGMIFTLCATYLRMRPCAGNAVSAKPRRGFAAGRRLAAAALVALSAVGAFANPTSVTEWYASVEKVNSSQRFVVRRYDGKLDKIVSESINPEDIVSYNGQNRLEDWPDNEIARGVFPRCSGVELVKYAGVPVWTLRMSDNAFVDCEISANRSFAIELTPGASAKIRAPYPYTSSGRTTNAVYGIDCYYGVLIYGNGTLSVSHNGSRGHGVKATYGDLLITGGASVHVQTDGARAIDAGPSEEMGTGGSLSVIGALLETTGGGIWSHGDILFDRAAVNILSFAGGVNSWGDLTIDRSFCTSIAKSAWALNARKVLKLDNSIVYALSKEDTCVRNTYASGITDPSAIGKGLYKFATLGGDGESAIEFSRPLTFDGGELVTCAPGGRGMSGVNQTLTVNSGLIRNQYSMAPNDEFVVCRELMEAYGIISGWESLGYETAFDPYDAIELFLGQTMPDWIVAQGIEIVGGKANDAISLQCLYLNGGTIIADASQVAVSAKELYDGSAVININGGSLRGPVSLPRKALTSQKQYPRDANGNDLVCVSCRRAVQPRHERLDGPVAKRL